MGPEPRGSRGDGLPSDDLNAARGILLGLVFGGGMWAWGFVLVRLLWG